MPEQTEQPAAVAIEPPDVAAARQRYKDLAEQCRRFDPETLKLARQWNQEIADRFTQRKRERQALVDRKGFAFRAWQAAQAGQADLRRELDAQLAALAARQDAALAAARDAEAKIDAIRQALKGGVPVELVHAAATADAFVAAAEPPAEERPVDEPPAGEAPPAESPAEDPPAGSVQPQQGELGQAEPETGEDEAAGETAVATEPTQPAAPDAARKPDGKSAVKPEAARRRR